VAALSPGLLVTHDVLVVFVKAPRTGTVKTRLIPALGAEGAAELYRLLAEEEIRRTEPGPEGEYDRVFFYSPEGSVRELEEWLGPGTWLPQEGADLGARMHGAFAAVFRRGARRAAVIGTDVPWVSRDLVCAAFRALDENDVVVGPARDGGYYLLALDRPRPRLFADIPWSTGSVLEATFRRAAEERLRVGRLAALRDIDTIEDLLAVRRELEPLLVGAPRLMRLIDGIV
jgi:rSAM/selenodomain-associated transferase 1